MERREIASEASRQALKDGPLWGICLGHTFTHWYIASLYLVLPYMMLELGFTVAQAGLLITMVYVAKSIAGMPIGALTDMTDRKTFLLFASLLLASLPFAFMSFANAYWGIVAFAIVMGIGSEMWHPASFATLSQRYPQQRGLTFGLHGMAANLGDLLAPAVVGALLLTLTWREVLQLNLLPGLLVGALVLLLLRKLKVVSNERKVRAAGGRMVDYGSGLKELLRNREVLLLSLASGIRSMAQNGLMTFLPIYLALELGLSPIWVGIYLSVLQTGGLIAAPIVGSLSDRIGRRNIVMSGMILSSLLIVGIVVVPFDWLLIATVAVLGFFLYSLRPVMQAWAMESTTGKMAGTTTSMLFTTQSLLSSSSPLIGGLLADRYGVTAAFYLIAGVILLGNLVVYLLPRVPGTKAEPAASAGGSAG